MDFFTRFTREKTPQNNFSSQNFSVENNTQTKYVGRRQFLNYVFISVGVCPLLLRHTLLSLNVIMLGWEPDVE